MSECTAVTVDKQNDEQGANSQVNSFVLLSFHYARPNIIQNTLHSTSGMLGDKWTAGIATRVYSSKLLREMVWSWEYQHSSVESEY